MTAAAPHPGQHGPVFIVGQARSGSSMLYRLVQGQPRFLPAGGEHLSESHFMTILGRAGPFDGRQLRAFARADGDRWSAFQARIGRADRRRRRLVSLLRPQAVRSSPRLWAIAGGAEIARAYIDLAATARGADRLVEKTPGHLPWLAHLASAFPDARTLCITRHPVATYASFRRRAADDPQAGWADLSAAAFAARWRREAALVSRWERRYPCQFRLLRYEDLVADPGSQQASLFDWLGEAPRSELPGQAEPDRHAPPTADALFGPIAATGSDWRAHLDDATAAALEAALSEAMSQLGFTRLTS